MPRPTLGWRRLTAAGLASVSVLAYSSTAHAAAPSLNLDTLTASQAETMLQNGSITSVELVEAYISRIGALNKSGPGLNAVTAIDPDVLAQAQQADAERAAGMNLGPAMGLPILLKDIIDVKGMPTTAGDWALRASYPAQDSGVAKELKAHGVIILGKTGLSEWANNFGNNPNGFSNLTGQVLNALDTGEDPSGSSSGSASAASASLSALTIGTETSGSIISPSTAQGDVGIRPTVGLVPGYGIAPISVSQDTAGPIERTVSDAAMALQSIAEVPDTDPTAAQEYTDIEGPNAFTNGDIPSYTAAESGSSTSSALPNYMSALSTSFVQGQRIGYNSTCTLAAGSTTQCAAGSTQQAQAYQTAVNTLAAAGATMVPDATVAVNSAALNNCNSLSGNGTYNGSYEDHATIDEYYRDLGPNAPVQSLAQEVAVDNTDPQESEKYSNSKHAAQAAVDDSNDAAGQANQNTYQTDLPCRKALYHAAIDSMMNNPGDGGGPVIAVIGSVGGNGPTAGYPEMALPYGYTTTQRRNIAIDINGGAYDERNIIGVGYVLEQAAQGTANARQSAAATNPAAYRCAQTATPEPFASRGHCNPNYQSVMAMLGNTAPATPSFPLETTSASSLETMMNNGSLTSEQLVRDELYRIAQSNANGPAIQAIRALNANVIADAQASDAHRAAYGARGPMEGIPVLVNDSIDVKGLATSGGSIALQDNMPAADSTLVAKLRAQGAIILGDTNITELNGAFDPNIIQGYSSLGGQVLLPSDTDRNIGGSSAGSAAAVAAGFAPLAVGMETSTNQTMAGGGGAQMIAPAANAGIVALKPTLGLVSMTGVMPVASTQDAAGPMGQTVTDVANGLTALTGGATNYAAGLSTTALQGTKIATVSDSSTTDGYAAAVTELGTLGSTTTMVTPGAATSAPSVIPYEEHLGLDSYLGNSAGSQPTAGSLAQVIHYNNVNPVEGLKFQQEDLTQAEALNTSAGSSDTSTNTTNTTQGQSDDRAVINNILTAGPYSAIIVPETSSLVDIADRAGYPVLTVPAAFGVQASSTGSDPFGVDLIGGANSEATLLNEAYAYEQATQVRATGPSYLVNAATPNSGFSGAPSETNQSMWRCIVGSAFNNAYSCNSGDLQSNQACLTAMTLTCADTSAMTTSTTTTTTTSSTTSTRTTSTPTTSTPTTTTTSTPTLPGSPLLIPPAIPAARTTTFTVTSGNAKFGVTIPVIKTCLASTAKLAVKYNDSVIKGSKKTKLTFVRATLSLDKKLRATVKKKSASLSLKLTGLKQGTHTLEVTTTYHYKVGKRMKTSTKTQNVKFKVC